ncbi:MAG: CvpA family protein [Campylobacterota bacterium]|nr:CvpA family protein [Campylobacterota bacterium]
MENINIFDIIIVTLITLLGLKGLVRGFTKEFFGLVGIVGGVFIASRVAGDMGNIINDIIPLGDNENTILLVGFVLSLVSFWIIAYIIGALISKVFSMSGLGIFDKLLGFTFGASKIFLLFSIIVYAATNVKTINDNIQPKVEDSIVFPILVEAGNYIVKLDTKEIQKEVKITLEDVVNSTKETIKDISDKEINKRVEEELNGTN